MRRVQVLTAALVLACFSTAATPTGAQGTNDATIASVKTTYEVVKGYITKAAAQVPEATYKYQPTKEVRTMGQLFGHIANANGMICATATGTKPTSSGDAEKLATKAEIQKALAESFAACDQAFSTINPVNANEPVKLFNMAHTRIGVMAFNNAHDFEHYGNIVTYMRMNGMVPPSSGGGGGDE